MLEEKDELLENMAMVSEIVAAYVSNHTMEPSEIPNFIKIVHRSLHNIESGKSSLGAPGVPAVPIDESVNPDYIVCLEDGKRLKMLKRHLKTAYGMSSEQYKERWDLPSNYPMVAPNYAKKRQEIAKGIGLGTHRKKAAA